MRDYMLDIETLGTKVGSVILSIALVPFDDKVDDEVYFRLSIDEQIRKGLTVDPETLNWWFHPDRLSTFLELIRKSDYEVDQVIAELAFAIVPSEHRIWCHGAAFDVPMVEALCHAFNLSIPWSYKNVRDTRTLFELADVNLRDFENLNPHNALEDARTQARAVKLALSKIMGEQ